LRAGEYGGPLRGALEWSGRLAPHQSLTIQAGHVLSGALEDDLPRVPVTVESATPGIAVAEAPSGRNNWDRLVLRNDSDRETVQRISVRWSVVRSAGAAPAQAEAKLAPLRAALRNDEYGGPLRGTVQWSGRLAPHQSLTIQGGQAAAGTLQNDLPRVPVAVVSQTPFVSVLEAPSERNHWDRVVLRNDSDYEVDSVAVSWSVIR